MVLTADATNGFVNPRPTSRFELYHVPGNPGDALVAGDKLKMSAGVAIVCPADDATGIGTCKRTMTVAAATTAFPLPGKFDPAYRNADSATLVPILVDVGEGVPIELCTFENQADEDVAAYVSATRSTTLTTGLGTNSDGIGALVLVYAGTGAGQVNVVESYTQATKVLVCHRKFAVDLDTTSKIIILEGEGTGVAGVGFFGQCERSDENTLDVADGADATGDRFVMMNFTEAHKHLQKLQLPTMDKKHMFA